MAHRLKGILSLFFSSLQFLNTDLPSHRHNIIPRRDVGANGSPVGQDREGLLHEKSHLRHLKDTRHLRLHQIRLAAQSTHAAVRFGRGTIHVCEVPRWYCYTAGEHGLEMYLFKKLCSTNLFHCFDSGQWLVEILSKRPDYDVDHLFVFFSLTSIFSLKDRYFSTGVRIDNERETNDRTRDLHASTQENKSRLAEEHRRIRRRNSQ